MGCMEASMFPVENQLDGSLGNAQSHTLACQHVRGQTQEGGLTFHSHTRAHTHSQTHTLGKHTHKSTYAPAVNKLPFSSVSATVFKWWFEVKHICKLLLSSLYVLMSEGCLKCQRLSRIQRICRSTVVLEEVDLKEGCTPGKSY